MHLVKYSDVYQTLIETYCLSAEQLHYTSEPKEAVALTMDDPNRQAMLAFKNKKLVGFLILHKTDSIDSHSEKGTALLIRNFSIDYRHLGHGYAQQIIRLVTDFAKINEPKVKELLLSVNENMLKKYETILYKNFGFKHTGIKKQTLTETFVILKLEILK